jgi:hypothetical protein
MFLGSLHKFDAIQIKKSEKSHRSQINGLTDYYNIWFSDPFMNFDAIQTPFTFSMYNVHKICAGANVF